LKIDKNLIFEEARKACWHEKTTKIILNLSTCSATAHALELLEEAKLTISLD
jgi:hypothetical protein